MPQSFIELLLEMLKRQGLVSLILIIGLILLNKDRERILGEEHMAHKKNDSLYEYIINGYGVRLDASTNALNYNDRIVKYYFLGIEKKDLIQVP
jgi:hypothetical protein